MPTPVVRLYDGSYAVDIPPGWRVPAALLLQCPGQCGRREAPLEYVTVGNDGLLFPVHQDERDASLFIKVPICYQGKILGAVGYTVTLEQDASGLLGARSP